jgi:hypothetical protein
MNILQTHDTEVALILPNGGEKAAPANPSAAGEEIYKLESSITLLVDVTNRLKSELDNSNNNRAHLIAAAKLIQSNVLAIHKLTLSVHHIKSGERRANVKDVKDWESL